VCVNFLYVCVCMCVRYMCVLDVHILGVCVRDACSDSQETVSGSKDKEKAWGSHCITMGTVDKGCRSLFYKCKGECLSSEPGWPHRIVQDRSVVLCVPHFLLE
jgi:hypothetical protein